MNSLLLNEWRGMKNYSVSGMSGLHGWWQNQEWFWWMKVGWKTLCPLIKGAYSQEVKELLGPIPRSSWSKFTTGWCFLIHGSSLSSVKSGVGKKTVTKSWCRGTARLVSAQTVPEPWWHPGLCEWFGAVKFEAEHLKMCLWEDDAGEVGFE